MRQILPERFDNSINGVVRELHGGGYEIVADLRTLSTGGWFNLITPVIRDFVINEIVATGPQKRNLPHQTPQRETKKIYMDTTSYITAYNCI